MKFSYAAIILGAASIVSAQSAACTAAVAAVPACGVSYLFLYLNYVGLYSNIHSPKSVI